MAEHTGEVGAIALDKRHSDGGDYADTHARYDYITVNHFADVTDGPGRKGITLSNPDLAFAKLGKSTPTSLDTATPQINMLAGGQVDGRYLGIPDQYDATHFLQRFALRPHGTYDAVASMKFALEHQNPVTCGPVISADDVGPRPPYPADTYSLLAVADPNVLAWAIKPAEEGIENGVIVRLWNVSDNAVETRIKLQPQTARVHRTTHIETDLEFAPLDSDGSAVASFARQQLQTYRLELKDSR